MDKYIFPKDFIWGASSASYQIEGGYMEDNKGISIWDKFSEKKDNIVNNDTGNIACDHYHRYKEDIKIMKEIGLDSYRFSISWPRIFPKGNQKINQKGLDFYKNLIEELLKNNIKPMVTLYHWDLPQNLQEKGGWVNRDTAKYFHQYSLRVIKEFDGLVDHWITHNEPWIASFLGYAFGQHAPGIKDYQKALQSLHHILLSHGMVTKTFKKESFAGKIGISLNITDFQAATDKKEDLAAVWRQDNFMNKIVLDPLFHGDYPQELIEFLTANLGEIKIEDKDMSLISYPSDFLGLNYYSRNIIKFSAQANILETAQVKKEDQTYTEMGWEVYPQGLYNVLNKINQEYTDLPIYITENGAAFKDELTENGEVNDIKRINYLKKHMIKAHQAIEAGIPLKGYYLWSIMDNFEWAYGYSKRFGLVYIDFSNLKRYIKDSGKWYQKVIENNGIVK